MRKLLLSVLVVGLFAGQAFGALYTLDKPTALTFQYISNTDSGAFPAAGDLDLVAANPSAAYGPMMLEVGFAGDLGDGADADNTATVRIGKSFVGAPGPSFTELETVVANDDDDPWSVQLFAVGTTSGERTSGFFTLAPGAMVSLQVTGVSGSVTQFGLDIQGTFTGLASASPSNPDFYHISAVPVPGAVLLGFLGLGAAGVKLRRFV